MSVGFRPRTEMVEAEKLPNGAIKVNDFQQILGDENIYVIGDSSAIKHSVTWKPYTRCSSNKRC